MTLFKRDKGPRHVEVWGHIVDQNRFLRRGMGAALALAFLGLAAGAYGMLVAMYRPLAFHVDADGQATYVGRLREQAAPSDAEVRYVAKEFLKRYVAFNSLTIESDLADAWNLMTDELRQEQENTLAEYQRQRGQEFVAYIKAQGIQTALEFNSKRTEVTDHNAKTFTVRLLGVARTWPLNRVGEDAAFSEKDFESFVTLVRCPRTEGTPNGLLVAKVSTRFYVASDETDDGTARPAESDDQGGAK
jgi:hypothetical protein